LTEALEAPASPEDDPAVAETSSNDVTAPEPSGESDDLKKEGEASAEASTAGDVVTNSPGKTVPVLTKPKVVLSGHFFRVVFVTWSPHKDGQLLSVSYDNSARVSLPFFS